jgi:uncharacterized membrane protein YfcA
LRCWTGAHEPIASGPDVVDRPGRSAALTVEPALVAELLALGCATGFLAGLLGIGGGMLMVPFLTLILSHRGVGAGLAVKMAVATAMATILFTSIASVSAHHRLGKVRWRVVAAMAPGIACGGLLAGAGAFALIKGAWLAIMFAAFVGFSATQMLLGRKPAPGRAMPGAVGQAGVGAVIGFVSGLVGAGGAFISVPFMTWCNLPIQAAVATSAALGFPIALANTLGYVVAGWNLQPALPGGLGYLYLPALAILAVASMAMAPLGARTAHAMDRRQLQRFFAALLYGLAAYMLWRGLMA